MKFYEQKLFFVIFQMSTLAAVIYERVQVVSFEARGESCLEAKFAKFRTLKPKATLDPIETLWDWPSVKEMTCPILVNQWGRTVQVFLDYGGSRD